MIKLTVSRDDNIYECFPDVAMTPDGTLVCIYRECMMHAPFPFSRIAVRRSTDGGYNWQEKRILTECVPTEESLASCREWLAPDAIAGYEQSRARVTEDWQIGSSINCSRMICLADGTLFLIADYHEPGNDGKAHWINRIWRSTDNGETWQGPEIADLPDGLVPSVTQLRDGAILVGLAKEPEGEFVERQFWCRSDDGGYTWGDPVFMPDTEEAIICEMSLVELYDGTLVGFGRDLVGEREKRPHCGIKVISRDGGKTWDGPFDTWLMGCEGRPKAGLLDSGEVCVTFRADMPNELLGMHVMTQEAAAAEETGHLVKRMPLPEDIPGQQARESGEERPWYMTSYYPGRTFILDCDRSVHRDSGYSGWVQLPSGEIFVVDYINDDAPLAQIRGYLVSRQDYMLFPPGDLPWLHPSGQPFRAITYGMARRQHEQNRQTEEK